VFGSLTERLALLRAVDAIQTDTFSAITVQNCDGVSVEDGNDRGGYFRGRNKARQECYEQ